MPLYRMLQLIVVGAVLCFASTSFAQITGRKLDELPVPHVDRPLTLPKLNLAVGLDGTLSHFEANFFFASLDATGGSLDLGGALGVTDDVEIEAVVISMAFEDGWVSPSLPLVPFEGVDGADWGLTRLGATLRFFAADAAEVGARFRFLVDNNATLGFNGGLPIRLRLPGVLRFDTGFHFIGLVPTRESSSAVFGLIDVGSSPLSPEAGFPLRLAIQTIDELWIGLNTGFGVLDVGEDDSAFMPLGATLGGSIPVNDVILDLTGSFLFPTFFLLGGEDTDEVIGSELWQIGLSGKVSLDVGN